MSEPELVVTAVLLHDGWHQATDYDDTAEWFNGGPSPALGFTFVDEEGDVIAGPASSVLAVRLRSE